MPRTPQSAERFALWVVFAVAFSLLGVKLRGICVSERRAATHERCPQIPTGAQQQTERISDIDN